MQISAIGGFTGGAAGGTMGAAGAAAAGTAAGAAATGLAAGTAAAGALSGTSASSCSALEASLSASTQALSDVAQNFNDINLLFTLLILSLLEKGDDKQGGAAGVLGFLAGLSLASQLGQSPGQPLTSAGGGAGVGGQLDVSA